MLRHVTIDRLPSGYPVNIPAELSEDKLDQYVKRFIEIAAAGNMQDLSGTISLFRSIHGGEWTMRIINACLDELRSPSIFLDIDVPREGLVPAFEWLIQEHQQASDADFGYPNRDISKLPR